MYIPDEQVLYIIRGLPGSGKSTLAKRLAPDSNYAADDFFIDKNGEYRFDRHKLPKAHAFCYKNVENAMLRGDSIIAVANTFTRRAEYEDYVRLAEKLGYIPIEIICKGTFQSIHDVPEKTIQNMMKRFEY